MSYPTEAEQEAFTAGWNAAIERMAVVRRHAEVGVAETMAEYQEPEIEVWISKREDQKVR